MSSHLLLSSAVWGDQKTKPKPRCGLSHRSGVDSSFLFIQCLQFHWPPTETLQASFPDTKSNPISIHSQEMLSDLKVGSFFSPVHPLNPLVRSKEWVSRREKQQEEENSVSLLGLPLVPVMSVPPSPPLLHRAQPQRISSQHIRF